MQETNRGVNASDGTMSFPLALSGRCSEPSGDVAVTNGSIGCCGIDRLVLRIVRKDYQRKVSIFCVQKFLLTHVT